MSELKDSNGQIFTTREDLERICLNFYQTLYQHKPISEDALKEVFEGFPGMTPQGVSEILMQDITEDELYAAVKTIAKGKAPGHDGVPIEFFLLLWPTIGKDFHSMILRGIGKGILHKGMTKGIISLIPKEGDSKDFNFWRPITLLTTAYKIFAKALQLRLQPVLKDIISPEQTAFLPLRFILDNIVLTQETLHWAKTSRQPTVFLKLDFSKAYDKVSWRFLFHAMQMIGIRTKVINWVKLLFNNATAAVNLNGSPGQSFSIKRGVRQGCPLAPYLFLIVGETLTFMIKKQ